MNQFLIRCVLNQSWPLVTIIGSRLANNSQA